MQKNIKKLWPRILKIYCFFFFFNLVWRPVNLIKRCGSNCSSFGKEAEIIKHMYSFLRFQLKIGKTVLESHNLCMNPSCQRCVMQLQLQQSDPDSKLVPQEFKPAATCSAAHNQSTCTYSPAPWFHCHPRSDSTTLRHVCWGRITSWNNHNQPTYQPNTTQATRATKDPFFYLDLHRNTQGDWEGWSLKRKIY